MNKSLNFVLFAVKHPRETNRLPWAEKSSTWIQRRYPDLLLNLGLITNRPSEACFKCYHLPSPILNKKKHFPPFPPQGIQFLLENDLLQQTPEDIAQFLYKGEGLNKTVIGDYLGER